MGILKKIWYWFFGKSSEDLIKEYDYSLTTLEKRAKVQEIFTKVNRDREGTKIKGGVNPAPTTPRPEFIPPPQNPATYNTGGYIKNAERYVAPRYSEIISSSNNDNYRNNNDNFLAGAMVGYVIADSLNDNSSHRDVEETKSNKYESSYVPSSSSSYDSGSYSSSSDSGSSSSCSCDSGC